jgi:hypothetical protein
MKIVRFTLLCGLFVTLVGAASRSLPASVYGASPSFQSETTPSFVQAGRRYAFTWSGGGPAQTYTVKVVRPDGWVLVDVAEENINPAFLISGEFPTRWLNVSLAISIQEMRPVIQ